MCQGLPTNQQCANEATPRNGDSAKKRRLTDEEIASLRAPQEIGAPDSPYTAEDPEDLDLFDQPLSPEQEPVSPVRRRSSGSVGCMVAEAKDRAACLREEDQNLVQAAYGYRPEFKPAKRTQAQRLRISLACDEPRVGPPQDTEKYALQRKIGEGATAAVWNAMDTDTGDSVAIKVVRTDDFHQSVEVEAMTAVQGDANVLCLKERFMFEGDEHVVTELAEGDLLQELQNRGPVPEAKARVHGMAVMSALETLHRAGYSHRDVKLENLLVSQTGALLLGDFGSAAPLLTADGTPVRHWTPMGSESYMAPEVLAAGSVGADYEGRPADVWSTGVVLYAIVAGEFPFESASPECIRYQGFMQGEHDWPVHFSPALIELITSMLTSSSHQRTTLEAALAHKWFSADGIAQ